MALDEAEVAALVVNELGRIGDPRVAAKLRTHLVTPRKCLLQWDYGPETEYPGFVVAEFAESGTGIAFSEYGFGPTAPWILTSLDHPGFGMDCCAYARLEGAFRESMAWDEPSPSGYEIE